MNYYNYYTEVEDHFLRRRGKPLIVSPLDWSLIKTWKQSGVPLHVALRGIDIAMDQWHSRPRRKSEKLGTLYYCHDAVMQEYAGFIESHVGQGAESGTEEGGQAAAPAGSGDEDGPARADVLRFLETRISEINALLAKHRCSATGGEIERIVSRLAEIASGTEAAETIEYEALDRDLGILDQLLVAALEPCVPQEEKEAWEKEARKELKIYKKHLPKETYARILDNYMRGRVHRFFRVGELSLFHIRSRP